jgi:cell division protein ZapA
MASIQIAAEMLSMRAPDGPLGSVAVGDFKRKLDEMHGQLNLVLPEAKPE